MDRRNFIEISVKISFLSFVSILFSKFISSCEKDESILNLQTETIKLDDYEELSKIGGMAAVFLKNTPIPILIKRISLEEFIIVDRTCTHQGCTVDMPDLNLGYMECPCHGAKFSIQDFSVIQNPADGSQIKNLKKYSYLYDKTKNELTIDFSKVI